MNRNTNEKGGAIVKTKRRLFSALLILLIIFVLVASYFFILHETRHDCTGDDCPVCALVAICRNTLKVFSVALILFALILALTGGTGAVALERAARLRIGTPVSLKDRLLN